jgi:Peptidase family C25
VLTANQFTTALQPLISHKNTRGLSTKLVTLGEIYNGVFFLVKGQDDPEKIKYFIKDAIEQWAPVSCYS